MAITYPISLPATPAFRSCRWTPRDVVARSTSPFDGTTQVFAWPGQWWEVEVALPPMKRDKAEPWIAAFMKLRGPFGTFLLGDPDGAAPRGTWAGTPLVKGAGQTGDTLVVDGLSAGATAKAGDYIQLGAGAGARLHKVLDDAAADGTGTMTLTIWPRLRASPADNGAVIVDNAKGVFRLASSVPWESDAVPLFGISFTAAEAL